MADGTIDSLNIQISSDANRAIQAIDSLQKKLGELNSALNGLGIGGLSSLSSGVAQLSHAMSAFKAGEIKTADFTRIATGLNKLSTVNVQGVSDASRSISTLTSNLSELRTISFDSSGIENIASAIAKLGRASVTEATQNLEFLKSSVAEFVSGMNGIGSLNFGTDNLYKLVSSVSRLGSKTATQSVKNLPQISTYLRDFVTSMNSVGSVTFNFDGLEKLVGNISRLGGVKATQSVKNLEPIKSQLLRFIDGLNGIGSLKFDMTGLNELVGAISRLGGKAAGNAIPHIEGLGVALKQLMATLSTAPVVSQNLIDMTNALANLAKEGSKVGSATKTMQSGFANLGKSSKAALKSTKSLVSKIGMFYARFFLLIRGIKELVKAAKSAMDYVETLNYFNAAFRQVASKADVSDWEKYGYKSAEAYANSFEARSKQLTQKLTGFTVSDEGDLSRTGMPSLGLDPNKVLQYQATFAQMASSMGVASEQSLKLSNALTMIGADLASVRNMEFEDVWRDMASGMVGMSRTLDKYGVNIRNVNLQQELYNLGINKSIAKLNQQDKAVLRTIVLLNSTRYAWGDLANTINQPANSLRLLQSNFASLARTIGSLFIPVITKVLPYISALVIALQKLFAWIGGLLGVKLSGFTSSVGGAAVEMGDFADSADDAAGGLGDANKEAKKLKGNLQSFDELNTISVDTESGGGGGAGGGIGGIPELSAALDSALAEYQKAWDAAYANMENRANELSEKVVSAFKRIWDTAEPTREAITKLWNEGLSQIGNFTWTALKDFWNEFLVPVGNWMIADDSGLPRFFNITNDLLTKIDWEKLNNSLATFFESLQKPTQFTWNALIDFYDKFLSPLSIWTMSKAIPELVDIFTSLNNSINWKNLNSALSNLWTALEPFAEKVGDGVVHFFDDLGKVLSPLINTILPLAINLISGIIKVLTPFANEIGYLIGLNLGISSLSKSFKTLSKGLGFIKKAITGSALVSAFKSFTGAVPKIIEGYTLLSGGAGSLREVLELEFPKISKRFSGFTSLASSFKGFAGKIVESYKLISGGAGTLGEVLTMEFPKVANAFSKLFSLLTAHPYLAVAAAIGGISLAIIELRKQFGQKSEMQVYMETLDKAAKKIEQNSKERIDRVKRTSEEIHNAGQGEREAIQSLMNKYIDLENQASSSSRDKKMEEYAKKIAELLPEADKYIDVTTGKFELQGKEIKKLIDLTDEYYMIQAAQDSFVDLYKEKIDAQKDLDDQTENLKKAIDARDKARTEMGKQSEKDSYGYNFKSQKDFEEAQKRVDEYTEKVNTAQESLDLVNNTIDDTNEIIMLNNDAIEDGKKQLDDITRATPEFQQKLSDLSQEFSNFGVVISNEYLDKLALDDTGLTDDVINAFDTLKNQTEISGEEVKRLFGIIGRDIPKEFANTLSQQTPEVRVQFAALFADLSAGVPVDSVKLKSALEVLGYDLPNEFITALSSKGASAQAETIEFLGKIEGGKKLVEGNLIKLFSNFGYELPAELVKSLTSNEVTSDMQKAAIELIGQIFTATDDERGPLLEKLNALGIEGADNLNSGLGSKDDEAIKTVKGMANTVKDTAKTELDPSARGSGSLYEIGKNTGEGFLSGLQASWGSVKTWVGGAMKDFKNKITGTDGLDINSPSKVMKKFGVFAIEGFNIGLSNEMQDTYLSLDKWIANMKKVDIPEFTTGYEINRSIYDKLDFQYHSPEINTKGIDTQISLADLIDYDRLGKAVYEAQNRAMQENPMVIGDEAIYRSWHRSQKSNYYGTNKLSLSGI